MYFLMLRLLCLNLLVCAIHSYKILVIFHMPLPSHYILGSALAKGLAEAGHDVTMVSPFEEKDIPKHLKFKSVVLSGVLDKWKTQKINMFEKADMNVFKNIPMINYYGNMMIENTLKNPNFQELLHSGEKFDAIIVKQFANDVLKVLGHHYGAPVILYSTMGANSWINPIVANPSPPSYIPDFFLNYSSKMTFWERLTNTLFGIVSELNRQLIFFPQQAKLVQEYFPNSPDFSDINYNVSLVLLNSHESINQPVPNVPSMVRIGGYHVSPPKKLPEDLQDFMDNAKEGVVYFSMGSNLNTAMLPVEKREAIVKTFAKLKEKVLWKWEEDQLPNQPDNLKISKWFPQQDILGHPNLKLFITQGGLLSTTETIYHGVPVLTIPIAADQKINAQQAQANGYGIYLPYRELDEKTFSNAVNEILNNPKYRENAKTRSKIMHDREVHPMKTAIYWIEYTIRHKGAPHLKVAGVDLAWYQYILLDVIAFLTCISVGSMYILYFLVKKLCSIKRTRANDQKKKKN